jgi:hypothetical protein
MKTKKSNKGRRRQLDRNKKLLSQKFATTEQIKLTFSCEESYFTRSGANPLKNECVGRD